MHRSKMFTIYADPATAVFSFIKTRIEKKISIKSNIHIRGSLKFTFRANKRSEMSISSLKKLVDFAVVSMFRPHFTK